MSVNKILITLELTPDGNLLARNAVTGDELERGELDWVSPYQQTRTVARVIGAVQRELAALAHDDTGEVVERYT